MLRELHIQNFAIIEQLRLSFGRGLNILSGETGAGKSIIMGALALLLGGRASAEMIRSSQEEASVEALFDAGLKDGVSNQLEGWGIPGEENLVVKRVISRSGKSKAYINGSLASLQMLSQLGMHLISFSGQHEHQTLLQADRHVDILDAFGGLTPLRERVAQGYRTLQEMGERHEVLQRAEIDKAQKRELLQFQIKEIENARPIAGEEEQLRHEERIMSNAQRLMELSQGAYEMAYQDPSSALERLRDSLSRIKSMAVIDDTTKPIFSAFETTLFQLEDAACSLREYMQRINVDQSRQEEIEMRLEEISKLKKKYGSSVEKVLCLKEKAQQELDQIELNEEELEKIEEGLQVKEQEVLALTLELSAEREKAALVLNKRTEGELRTLGMGKTRFKVRVEKRRETVKEGNHHGVPIGGFLLTDRGLDTVEFLISPNPGEELRPMSKIASGGELSRMVLALKRIVAQEKESPTLVFDEVDSGIGGATAEVVGRKLQEIAREQQTLCITHLPQIASFADLHHSVYKEVRSGRTLAYVKKLDLPEEREEEIARMLGGMRITPKTREHAREMLRGARGSTPELS